MKFVASVTSKVTVTVPPPAATVVFPSVQDTFPPDTPHVVPVGPPEQLFATYVVLAGIGSLSDVIVAGPEPLFVYVIVYRIVSPGFAVMFVPAVPFVVTSCAVFASEDFGEVLTVMITGGVFVQEVSWLVHTVATFCTVGEFALNVEASVTSKVTVTVPLAGTVVFASVHDTDPPDTPHEATTVDGTPVQLFAT